MIGSDPGEPLRRRFLREVLVLCGIGIVVGGGTLATREFLAMKGEVERLTALAYEPHPGAYVPELQLASVEGDTVVLGRLGQPQLLFFFNTTCPHCRASVPGWNEIASHLRPDSDVALIGVAFDDSEMAEAYRQAQGLGFKVVPVPDPRVAGLYRINAVPAVVLVDHEGRIAYSRLGTLDRPQGVDSVLNAVWRVTATDRGEE